MASDPRYRVVGSASLKAARRIKIKIKARKNFPRRPAKKPPPPDGAKHSLAVLSSGKIAAATDVDDLSSRH